MFTVIYTAPFADWLNGFRDSMTRVRLLRRLRRLQDGHWGDVKPVGEGVYEMREHFGAGYRMYYIRRGDTVVVMLGGGDKSSQNKDIERAQTLAKNLKEED